MSIGSNLLMLMRQQNPGIGAANPTGNPTGTMKTNSDQVSVQETELDIKQASTHSKQMRRCMKNFNFKMPLDEIDKIIEEDEDHGER